jgi:hypothetical protein
LDARVIVEIADSLVASLTRGCVVAGPAAGLAAEAAATVALAALRRFPLIRASTREASCAKNGKIVGRISFWLP